LTELDISAQQAVAHAARTNHGQLVSILIRDVRDFQLAEDCVQEALEAALAHWQRTGPPHAPTAWLLQVARRKALDRLRRDKNFKSKSTEIAQLIESDQTHDVDMQESNIPDERLRLIFICCHPALNPQTSVALALRTLCGLTTIEIAKAFVVAEDAMAQRLVRARQKILKAGIKYEIPNQQDLPERLAAVLSTIYLTFNEGYAATTGEGQLRVDLCEEAIRLARLVHNLSGQNPEATGLLALLLLTHSRRNARSFPLEPYIPLEEQNRAMWDHAMIAEGDALLLSALQKGEVGPYQMQASISAIHASATSHSQTNWAEIIGIYDRLYTQSQNPVYRLNKAVAVSYFANSNNALQELDKLSDDLKNYQPFHAARADVLRRLGRYTDAKQAYVKAIELSQNKVERDFLALRCANLSG
jgi:RNA polymerase sigma-70 factor, ECF subfamily